MRILLTGGLGFIGSHVAVTLGQINNEIIIVDNLSNSSINVLSKIKYLVKYPENIHFIEGNVLDSSLIDNVFTQHAQIDAVIHFASLKAVGESIENPLLYYHDNLNSLFVMLECMEKHGCKRFFFSSSATVYGCDTPPPLNESSKTGLSITNPYGQTKFFQERILMDYAKVHPEMAVTILRYFNPVGAHPSGLLGEDPNGIPNNLFPYILRVATSRYPYLNIFGDDYNTRDGTGIRDFIHVMDLAEGHVAALDKQNTELAIYNLGTGKGTSIMELIAAFERVNNITIPYRIAPRRGGDIDEIYASAEKAKRCLGWETTRTLDDICRDGYRFMIENQSTGNNIV
jgi:UDP-glucose 4-epimerase